MQACLFLAVVGLILPVKGINVATSANAYDVHASERLQWRNTMSEPKQTWNYVNVRENAFMFWWLYYTTAREGFTARPLVIWLQGGPGASSTGFGNFMEIGPLDVNQNERNVTWVSVASILFIDNPVGSGFSYVTASSAYTTDVHGISKDLLATLTSFLNQLPDFKKVPLYIFSESYGGKMTAAFSQLLYKAVKSGALECNFQGLAMGDSWISPADSILSWGPYLYTTSLVDEAGLSQVNDIARQSVDALMHGDGNKSTELWSAAETTVEEVAGGVNFYNILQWGGSDHLSSAKYELSTKWLTRLYQRHVGIMQDQSLDDLMNGPIRKKLGIIPANVTWGGQSLQVFAYQSEDFMKPVVDIVCDLLNTTQLKVVVYNGQLDLIVDTIGTERWVQSLTWPGLPAFNASTRSSFNTATNPYPAGFVKSYDKFSFYWILNAGHMIPTDAPDAALMMLKKVIHVE